nr:lipid A biosynthesis acyltransferase [Chitinophagaceae bacterium]
MYFVVYGFLWLLSLLPLWFLYLISDAIYGLVFYILKYRRKVVFENLHKAFPQKTEKEIRKIAKKFYHNFVDMLVETIKMITISQRTLEKRISANWEILDQVYATGKSVQIHVGHNFNWEWGNLLLPRKTKYKVLAV